VGYGAWSGPVRTEEREELSDGYLQSCRVPLEPPGGRLLKCSSSTVFLNLCCESGGVEGGGEIPVVRG
jgi:hypothetical protein